MSLSNADVAKVALLARLRVSPDELETFTGQLNSIVDYVAQLQELDTTGVEPLAHGVEVRNVFRDDVRASPCPASRRWPTRPSECHELPGPRRPGMNDPLAREPGHRPGRPAEAVGARAEDADR